MFRIEMLPVAHGEALWIEYGEGGEWRRILIDGGPAHTYPVLRERLLHLPPENRCFELLVVTHIDCDHIDGIIRLLQEAPSLGCRFERIWFNGRSQLNHLSETAGPPLGPEQGDTLSLLISDLEEASGETLLNRSFPGDVVVVDRTETNLPIIELPGGMRLILLSPDVERLRNLKEHWEPALGSAGIIPGDEKELRRRLEAVREAGPLDGVQGAESGFEEALYELPDPGNADCAKAPTDELDGDSPLGVDNSPANGSSIALLAEYENQRLLLAGDAWPEVLQASLEKLASADGTIGLTGFKVPHHGSVGNTSADLLRLIRCKHYLVSTSGAVFRHPHKRCIELILEEHRDRTRPCLHFNYRTLTTEPWASKVDQQTRAYDAFHPKGISLVVQEN